MNEQDSSHLYTPRNRPSHRKKQKRSSSLKRSHSHHDVNSDTTCPTSARVELSVDDRAPGLLKIFGEFVVAGAQYKSVLVSTRSTAQELIKQALERYGLAPRLHRDFVLCESIGAFIVSTKVSGNEGGDNGRPDPSTVKKRSGAHQQRPSKNKHRSFHRFKSKFTDDRSPCGTPRAPEESPRTPLGSPRTPCGSPSTVRESPRARPGEDEEGFPWSNTNFNNSNNYLQSDTFSCVQWNVHSKFVQDRNNSYGGDHRVISPRSVSGFHLCNNGIQEDTGDLKGGCCHWKPFCIRVLTPSDRPLELQEFWKPPDGFSRRYELRRRCDITMESVDNETLGLNDNARKIMMSKLSPGVIPYSDQHRHSLEGKTILKDEWNKASGLRNPSQEISNESTTTNVVEGDPRQAYVCPSIYPYLLTLRGCSIHKDSVLYPLKSMSLTIGSGEKKLNSDDIKLSSEDVTPSHCRATLKRLPQHDHVVTEDKRQYWYCLDLDIFSSSFVTVNGVQVKKRATVYPGDLLGIGRQYLFLYKDPTGGHDIPSAVPWLPEQEVRSSLINHINSKNNQSNSNKNINIKNNNNNFDSSPAMTQFNLSQSLSNVQSTRDFGEHFDEVDYQDEDTNCLDDSSSRNTPLFLAYHKDKEVEVLECIADVKCHTLNSFPLTHSLLFLASHQYAIRKFSGDHQTTLFKRLVRVVRARVGVVSKAMSQQRQESAIFNDDQSGNSSPSGIDYFPCLVNWLSNLVFLMGHFRMPSFQTDASNLAQRNDVNTAIQDVTSCFERNINYLFQQTVYNVTKVLYDPINKFMESARSDIPQQSPSAIQRILYIMKAVHRLVTDLMLHQEVANQLMVYLLFFVSTTLFNRVIAKGAKLYNNESGSRLQRGMSELEAWATEVGLEVEFVRVSEHILSMVDLLSSSKRTLMKLTWQSFQTQFSPLTDVQLCKILSEYNLGEGVKHSDAWLPPYPIDTKEEMTISLSSHPPFFLPQQGKLINLCETFPPAFYRHLEQVQQKFSLDGEDAYCSGLSSAGNTPRLSESLGRGKGMATFFAQEIGASLEAARRDTTGPKRLNENGLSSSISSNQAKQIPPPPLPKPCRGPKASFVTGTPAVSGAISGNITDGVGVSNAQHPPPYNIAIKQKLGGQTLQKAMPRPSKSADPVRKNPFIHPVVIQHGSSTDFADAPPKQLPFNSKQINVLPNMGDIHLLQKKSNHGNGPQNHSKSTNKLFRSSDSSECLAQNHNNNIDLSSSYPEARPRPSSATDCVQSSFTGSQWPGLYQTASQKTELLKRRSNSALGHRHNDLQGSSSHLQANPQEHDRTIKDRRSENSTFSGNAPVPLNYEHVKDSTFTAQSHSSVPASDKYGVSIQEARQGNNQGQNGIATNSFSYGSLKRSPRTMNLSRQSSSDLRDAGKTKTEIADNETLPASGNGDDDDDDDDDKPPPLPPRGDWSKRQSPVGSRSPVLYSHSGRRESPQEPMLSSSYRSRSGSRTSVEIQDITENQYIIYNPESPVSECFEHAKTFPHFNRDRTVPNQGKPDAYELSKNETHVPPLELPDDLLGTSENEFSDEIFTNSFDKDYGKTSHMGSQSQDRYPDDIYIDVQDYNIDFPNSEANVLKVLPLDHSANSANSGNVSVRYRHTIMAESRGKQTTNGQVTGEVFAVTLHKAGSKLGMGLIDGLHTALKMPGIFVRNVLPDTPAAMCGCIRVGDQIVAVNGKSIIGADYDSAMRLIRCDGPQLNLLVAKCDQSTASKISASTA